MSIALLAFSALQSIVLQPLENMLHDSSEIIYKVNGDQCSPSHSIHAWTLMAVTPHTVGDRFKMAPSQELTLPSFSIKSALPPKKNPLYPPCPISLAAFKEVKVSMLYMGRKELHFFSVTLHCAWQNVLWL